MKKMLLLLILCGCGGDGKPDPKPKAIEIGMTKEQVLMMRGRPESILKVDSSTIYHYHIIFYSKVSHDYSEFVYFKNDTCYKVTTPTNPQ